MEFEYHPSWREAPEARPLSLSLPLTLDAHVHRGAVVEAYFDNLLPESDAIRRRLQQRFHTATGGAFDLLAALGRDCVGAVQILPVEEAPGDTRHVEARPLSEADVERELAGVTAARALPLDSDEFRISIAGAQEKTALLRHQGRWCRPLGSTPTTHIFKLPLGLIGNRQADFRTSVHNEWLCAQILNAFEVPVARCEIGQFGAQQALIVERFDRQLHSSGSHWLRLMQEDFAQATGTPWHRKYQSEGGPGVLELGRILRGSLDAPQDMATLFRAQVLFFMLAATDGHAKNFSLRLHAGGRFQLTPLYDVLSTWPAVGRKTHELPYEKLKLAMSVPGERPHYLLKSLQRRHFETLGRKLGLGADAPRLIDELVARAPRVIDTVQQKLPKSFPLHVAERIFQGVERQATVLERSQTDVRSA
jgi:serine/threonine-protein kinase HipA